MTFRYILMLIVSAVAGVISGCLWLLPNGLMGGVLAMSLAAGAIWLGIRRQKQDGKLTPRQIWQAGLVSGLLAGALMAAVSQACVGVRYGDFGPPDLPFWAPLVMGILYGPVVLWGYSARLSSSHPLTTALVFTGAGCFLLKTLATAGYIILFENGVNKEGILDNSVMLSLLGAVPFALLWVLGMALTDPAWSSRSAPARTA